MDIRKEISAALVDGFAIRFIAFPLETHLSAVKKEPNSGFFSTAMIITSFGMPYCTTTFQKHNPYLQELVFEYEMSN